MGWVWVYFRLILFQFLVFLFLWFVYLSMIGLQSDFCDIFGGKQFIEKSEWKKVAVDWPKDRMTHSTNDSFFSENMKIIFNGFYLEIIDYGQSGMMYLRRTYRGEVRIPRQLSVRENISAALCGTIMPDYQLPLSYHLFSDWP